MLQVQTYLQAASNDFQLWRTLREIRQIKVLENKYID